jgi:phosphate transport system permease protein
MTAQGASLQPEQPQQLIRRRGLSVGDPILLWASRILSLAALTAVVIMLLQTLVDASTLFTSTLEGHESPLEFLIGARWEPSNTIYGALPFIYGTVVTSIIALFFAVPLSVGVALLIMEYLPRRISGPVAVAIDLLAAVPSIVYGFWGILYLVPAVRPIEKAIAASPLGAIPIFAGPAPGPSYFVAGLVLTIMIIPIITAVTREAIAATPRLQREGAMALGATHWEQIRHVILPLARGGIFAGIILGLSRAIGETIAVLLVIGNAPQISASIFAPGYTLPSVIASEFTEANQPLHIEALIALGVVLFVLSFGVNLVARIVVGRFERRAGGADVR